MVKVRKRAPAKKGFQKPKVDSVLRAKQMKGKNARWDHNAASLSAWTKGKEKRGEQRKREEEELEQEGMNAKLDKQMTDVYKRVEALDSVNWSIKQKKDHAEAEFVRLGGIPLKRNKCSFTKHLERVSIGKHETAQKIALEEQTGLYDLVEGSKVKERRRENMLKGLRAVVDRKKEAKQSGNVHRSTLGNLRDGEVVLDKTRVKQMEIRAGKRRAEASSKGRDKSRGSMWDDKYDINRFNDPRALESGRFDQIGSNRRKGGRQGGRNGGKKRRH
eukprot:TRINITY_DN37346_c0_g1_i1.p2 TRINITY_DN37346_c0_g1~~TRINITY_DN37346_c0_g1_i1.p2  ORF type:complete len:274 (+),score=105.61 TRINITY_DN37346_c0_g1_i1:184-1005(+)